MERRGQVRQARWVMARSEESGLAGKAGRGTVWQVEVSLIWLGRHGSSWLGVASSV